MIDHKIEVLGTIIFALAVLHTFLVGKIIHFSHRFPKGSSRRVLFHLIGEIEVVFGFWAAIFMVIFAILHGPTAVLNFQDGIHFTEPIFVFCIMVVAATRPVMWAARQLIEILGVGVRRIFRIQDVHADLSVALILGPLAGSLITEPAAMTVTALILNSMIQKSSQRLMYPILAVLFVNISIGGALTNFAAPPILMVAGTWGWDTAYVFTNFGWKSMLAVTLNTLLFVFFFRKEISENMTGLRSVSLEKAHLPLWIVVVHYLFLIGIIFSAHHPNTAMGIFLLFLGLATVTKQFQDQLRLKESLLVAFFLAGIIMFGPFQKWWLQPLLSSLGDIPLYFGAAALTAVTDNAALTFLGAQVEGLGELSRYYLVAGAIAGGGLTIIANAPNAAGYSVLQNRFGEGLNPGRLFLTALIPTLIAIACLGFAPQF